MCEIPRGIVPVASLIRIKSRSGGLLHFVPPRSPISKHIPPIPHPPKNHLDLSQPFPDGNAWEDGNVLVVGMKQMGVDNSDLLELTTRIVLGFYYPPPN